MTQHPRAPSPYLLPEGNIQIAFSGGRTSAYMLHQILEANGGLPERARVVFANTGREQEGTLWFVNEVSHRFGVPIEWVEYSISHNGGHPIANSVSYGTAARKGEPFEAMIRHKRYIPNGRKRICTEQLKVRTARRYLVDQGWRDWTKALGIRADEPARHDQPDQPRERIWLPLIAAEVRKSDVMGFWRRQPFDLPPGTVSNCEKCFQFMRPKLARQIFLNPEDDWPERMESLGFGTFLGGISWAAYKEKVLAHGDLFDGWAEPARPPCGASDDGECSG